MEVKPKYNYELIEDYLNGFLDEATSANIRKLLTEDETARSIAKGILTLKQNFDEKETNAYLDQIHQIHLETIRRYARPAKTWIYWKIAAAILIVMASSFIIFTNSSPSIQEIVENELKKPYPISQNLRGNDSNIVEGLKLYANGSYQEATSLLERDSSAQGIFARGLSHFYIGNYQEAAKYLQHQTLDNSRFREQSRWFLSIAYLQLDNTNKTIEILNEIVSTKTHYKRNEAQQLLTLLRE